MTLHRHAAWHERRRLARRVGSSKGWTVTAAAASACVSVRRDVAPCRHLCCSRDNG